MADTLNGRKPDKKNPWKKPTLRAAAAALGRHHGHLARVISGERTSPKLLAAYKTWLKQHGIKP